MTPRSRRGSAPSVRPPVGPLSVTRMLREIEPSASTVPLPGQLASFIAVPQLEPCSSAWPHAQLIAVIAHGVKLGLWDVHQEASQEVHRVERSRCTRPRAALRREEGRSPCVGAGARLSNSMACCWRDRDRSLLAVGRSSRYSIEPRSWRRDPRRHAARLQVQEVFEGSGGPPSTNDRRLCAGCFHVATSCRWRIVDRGSRPASKSLDETTRLLLRLRVAPSAERNGFVGGSPQTF